MKITKKSAFDGDKAALVFKVFDKAIASYGVLPFDLEFHIGSQNNIDVDSPKIVVNYYDDFIQEADAKGIFARLMYNLHLLIAKRSFDSPEFFQQVIAGRRMAALCREELFYMMFLDTAKIRSIESFETHLSAILPYAIFSTVDAYNAELLYALIRKKSGSFDLYEKQAKKFLSAVCKPIDTEWSLAEAVKSYEAVINANHASIEI